MTNKTPPAWATQAAIQLSALDDDNSITLEYMAEVIARCSPDAEALAVALNFQLDAINEMLDEYSHNDKFMALPMAHARLCNMRDDIEAALAAYRARFPKVTP